MRKCFGILQLLLYFESCEVQIQTFYNCFEEMRHPGQKRWDWQLFGMSKGSIVDYCFAACAKFRMRRSTQLYPLIVQQLHHIMYGESRNRFSFISAHI